MQENQENFHFKNKRMHFSKDFKRKVLIEFAAVKKPKEAFRVCGFEVDNKKVKDLKYASKLLYKWKREFMNNRCMLSFLNSEFTDDDIENEILILESSNDNDIDDLSLFLRNKIKKYFRNKRKRKLEKEKNIEWYINFF